MRPSSISRAAIVSGALSVALAATADDATAPEETAVPVTLTVYSDYV